MRSEVWRAGEDAAAEAYHRCGYRVLARNWTCPIGELDLVLERDGTVVFCEVKARTSAAFGSPYEAVTAAKQRKLRALGEAFAARHGYPDAGYRFDVASVRIGSAGADVQVFEDAF